MTRDGKRKYDQRRESWGAVRKLPSGRYQASYPGPDGERYAGPMTYSSIDDARAWLSARRVEIQRGEWKSPAQLAEEKAETERLAAEAEKKAASETFRLYATGWVEQRVTSKGKTLRPKTAAEYRRQLDKGLSTFADDRITAITAARIRTWHAERMKAGATAAGAEARLLRAILNTAVVDGILESNPMPSNLTRSSTGVKHRPPTLDELGVMLNAIEPRFRLAILLAAYGNVRLSEWRALRRRDITVVEERVFVSVERQALFVAGSGWVVGAPKSDEGVRVVPLPTALTGDVEKHLEEHTGPFPESLLFAPVGHSEFLHDRQWNDAWNVARDAAGVRVAVLDDEGKPTGRYEAVVREHDLRAFALTAFAKAGGTLRETQKFGGHATVDAAMVYQHAAADRLAEIVDRMELPGPTLKRTAPMSDRR